MSLNLGVIMKTNLVCAAIVLVAGSVLAAPKDDVSAAITKLAAADNYSWKSAPVVDTNAAAAPGGRRGGGFGGMFGGGSALDGKTQKDGLTYLYIPATGGFGRRGGGGGFGGGPGGGGGFGGGPGGGGPGGAGPGAAPAAAPQTTTNEVVFKGEKGAIKTSTNWQTFAEATAPPPDNGDGGGGFGGFGGFNPNTMVVNNATNTKAPAAEAKELLGLTTSITLADGVYSGALTEAGAKARLTPNMGGFGGGGFGGGQGPDITGAKGSVKFWIKDGVLVKYEYTLQGSMDFGMGNPIDINRTTAVEIKDVGTTKIAVPDEAKKKMS
jgi:hypothetical protein